MSAHGMYLNHCRAIKVLHVHPDIFTVWNKIHCEGLGKRTNLWDQSSNIFYCYCSEWHNAAFTYILLFDCLTFLTYLTMHSVPKHKPKQYRIKWILRFAFFGYFLFYLHRKISVPRIKMFYRWNVIWDRQIIQ